MEAKEKAAGSEAEAKKQAAIAAAPDTTYAVPDEVPRKAGADPKTVTSVPSPNPSPAAQSRSANDAKMEADARVQASSDCGCIIL